MKYLSFAFLPLLLLLFAAPSFAQTLRPASASATAAAIATNSATTQVNYFLPYPGLLPDNVLYPLKMARDGVVGLLISDPLKKAKFDLLQADKRIGAALLLETAGDKKRLVVPTVSKAANYFEEAITETKQARAQGMQVSDMISSLRDANEKHQEVVRQIQTMLPAGRKHALDQSASRLQTLEKQVDRLMPNK